MATLVLPGDEIPAHVLPTGTGKRKTLKLGPGLRHIPPSTVVTTVAGALVTDNKKNAASIEFNSGRVIHSPITLPSLTHTFHSTSPTPATSSLQQ
jgi:exosome complex component RRP40